MGYRGIAKQASSSHLPVRHSFLVLVQYKKGHPIGCPFCTVFERETGIELKYPKWLKYSKERSF
ncbi:MAG: hypothetical protein J6Y89_01085, partial [Lachnospiraceae bacterium]|nr:hypothetical protein [Lachnospiraceae bacterium]